MAGSKSLVIVESPAKARTIGGILGPSYVVESSIGHIRDLPRNAKDVPPALKKESWARLGVDVEHGFKPYYVVAPDKKAQIAKLKGLLAGASTLYLATDEDREGESIAWHLLEVLKPKVPVQRMVFHEITRKAIEAAIANPRELDRRLVDAQEARRILDRLYGYEVSPVLWKKVLPRLSAGRVQSVATRIVVERELERMDFVVADYWDVDGTFEVPGRVPPRFVATLAAVDGQRVAVGRDFDAHGTLAREDAVLIDAETARGIAAATEGQEFSVRAVERKPSRRSPSAPFMTSTLQQEAGRKLRFSASRTMRAAQRLYESGYITYMRTDSITLSDSAIASARDQIRRLYGAEYLTRSPRVYKSKVKNAQEAHEAIRPAGDVFRSPEQVSGEVPPDEARLYELIWMRTIASEMRDAEGESVSLRLGVVLHDGRDVEFSVSGHTIRFPGFLRAYVEGSDDPAAEIESKERPLPPLSEEDRIRGRSFEAKRHETQAPARYTEASLVRRLEELGVGRPSTYASIITTILDRGYVWQKGTALVPSFTAFAVVALLKQHFGELVDYEFTARMEDDLDAIANGDQQAVPWLERFYFGAKGAHGVGSERRPLDRGLRALVADELAAIDARAINSLSLGVDDAGREILVRVGRFGAYLQRGETTARLPDDLPPDELTISRAVDLLDAPADDRHLGVDPTTGQPVMVRRGRFGAYVQIGENGDTKEKPRTSSLFQTMSFESVSLEDALRLLSLPRTVGIDPSGGQPITAQLGRYGPYVARGTDSRSLENESLLFSITLEQALALFAQPRTRKRHAGATAPLRELGPDIVSGKPIAVREGRFGPYVSDGETHASLHKGDTPSGITLERAHELLQARRDRGPSAPKRGGKKAAGARVKKPTSGNGKPTRGAADAAPAAKKSPAAKRTAAKKPASAVPTKQKRTPAKKAAAADASSKASEPEASARNPEKPQPATRTKATGSETPVSA
ncbi:MAG: type I DNA topoisomerase [Polyangiaceae bacterium]|nr:type I DNA topoisomerase [Polyangiaceae bacterium]